MIYVTVKGDSVDLIAFNLLGDEDKTKDLFRINPGLSNQPFLLPEGLEIKIPEVEQKQEEGFKLW